MSLKEKIVKLASSYLNEIVEFRNYFHTFPELSFEEYQTAAFISSVLDRYQISYQREIAKTGIVGLLRFRNPDSKTVALRADMDALPLNEENDVDYRSKNQGIMHACGHDAHMACLLGAANILSNLKNDLEGTIKLIFQPSEESYPGGAKMMIKEGVLENPTPVSIFGQHVLPELESGKVGIRSGKYMASTDEIYITVKGKGGHAATPHLVTDPILISSHIIVALQQVVSRIAKPDTPSVLSFGKIDANGRNNIIPEKVKLHGTFRTFDENWRNIAHQKIKDIALNIAKGMGASCNVDIKKGYPYVFNDLKLADSFRKYAIEYLGENNLVELDLAMTAEDFSYYSQKLPACFYRLGVRNEEKGVTSALHTSTFNIDEKSLETGMGLMAWIAAKELINR